MRIVDTIVTITPPHAETAVINTTSAPTAREGHPSAIQKIDVSWNRPTGYAHQEAAGFNLELIGNDKLIPLLAWDAKVTVYAIIDGDPAPRRMIALGWITETSRTPLKGIGHRIRVKCVNAIARAAGTRIGDKPWPKHTITQRLTALNEASPIGPIAAVEAPSWDNATRADLDVDSRPALDILHNSVDPTVVLEEAADGLIHSEVLTGSRVWWPNALNNMAVTGKHPEATKINANALENVPRVADRTSLLTHVTIEGKVPSDQPPSPGQLPNYDTHAKSWYNQAYGRQSAEHRVTTDIIVNPLKPASKPWQTWAQGLVDAGANPGERLEATRAITDRLDPLDAAQLVDITLRAQAFCEIENPPKDIDPAQRVIAGQLAITARETKQDNKSATAALTFKEAAQLAEKTSRWNIPINSRQTLKGARLDLQLTLEPTRLSGINKFRFNELPENAYLTFNRAGKTTIRQLAYVNRVLQASSTGATAKSRRFLNITRQAAFNQTNSTIANYAYLP
ncbi:hypothetical protein [Propionimicrobium lymphophilum]|uniref:hypothetical protein n=1 Tax=Propionimicrobium lymphophilum TaxID=33012 RepID=UPI003EC8599C